MSQHQDDLSVVDNRSQIKKVRLKITFREEPEDFTSEARQAGLSLAYPTWTGENLYCFVPEQEQEAWNDFLESPRFQGWIVEFFFDSNMVPLTVKGARIRKDQTALREIFACLQSAEVPVGQLSVSDIAVTLAVPRKRLDAAVQALNDQFQDQTPKAWHDRIRDRFREQIQSQDWIGDELRFGNQNKLASDRKKSS